MSVYIVTGKLGNGKTLASVGRITEYLSQDRKVATNLDLFMDHYEKPKLQHKNILRLPDKPTIADFEAIGRGHESDIYNEDNFGLLVLDECGTWFNSRGWQDKSRADVIDWLLHSRKLGWDVLLIVQDISILDKQARETLAEYTVYCRRMDRFRIPVVSPLVKALTGYNLTMPRVHVAIVKYGDNATYPTVDRWWYRGVNLYSLYDTRQVFTHKNDGVYSILDPYTVKGRYMPAPDYLQLLMNLIETPVVIVALLTAKLWAICTGRSPAQIVQGWNTPEYDRRKYVHRRKHGRLVCR